MEMLEHCVDAERRRVLDELRAARARPAGRVVISVPIEIGPALLGKQFFRAIAAWRGHGDYPHRETLLPARAPAPPALARPHLARARYAVDDAAGPLHYCGHKGFDWRDARARDRGALRRSSGACSRRSVRSARAEQPGVVRLPASRSFRALRSERRLAAAWYGAALHRAPGRLGVAAGSWELELEAGSFATSAL